MSGGSATNGRHHRMVAYPRTYHHVRNRSYQRLKGLVMWGYIALLIITVAAALAILGTE